MPAKGSCKACSHPESLNINEALIIEGKGLRDVAGRFGLSKSTVERHRDHLPKLLVEARRDLEDYNVDAVLLRIEDLERRTLRQLEAAEAEVETLEDRRVVLAAIREQRGNIEAFARVAQLISDAPQVTNVLIAPVVHNVILDALRPYGEARLAVSNALAELEANHNGG